MKKFSIPETFNEFENIILPTIKVSNEITYKAQETLPWDSKLGGCPYLKSEDEYPRDNEDKPYFFLAQINLEDISGIKDFPKSGLIQFYVKANDVYGLDEDDGFLVRYIEKVEKDETKLSKVIPTIQDDDFYPPYEREGKMNFEAREMPVSIDDNMFNEIFKNVKFTEKQEKESYDVFEGSGNRVGGYPGFTQYDPRENNKYDVLLLQLDIDSECDIMFGDSGIANFFISSEDLIKRDFSKVYYTWDCC
ncbi:DUF1963 domain-containing protein [Clostridium sp. CT7]|nr:DUF1963 domain-containing protein [Clostridium sp. CT7]